MNNRLLCQQQFITEGIVWTSKTDYPFQTTEENIAVK
jgi:hypothetical protein